MQALLHVRTTGNLLNMSKRGLHSAQINCNVWKWELDVGVKILVGFTARENWEPGPQGLRECKHQVGPILDKTTGKVLQLELTE